MFFTREDRMRHEALGPVAKFAAEIEQRYGLHGRYKELVADVQAFVDSLKPPAETELEVPVEPVAALSDVSALPAPDPASTSAEGGN